MIFFSVLSCKKSNENKILDCTDYTELARQDFENGNYVYYEFLNGAISDVPNTKNPEYSNEEFAILLRKENFRFETEISSDDYFLEAQFKSCYRNTMYRLVLAKFGKSHFDSLKTKADSIYNSKKIR